MQETVGHWKLQPGFLFLARLSLVLYTIITYIIFQLSVVTPSDTINAGSVTRNVSLFEQKRKIIILNEFLLGNLLLLTVETTR